MNNRHEESPGVTTIRSSSNQQDHHDDHEADQDNDDDEDKYCMNYSGRHHDDDDNWKDETLRTNLNASNNDDGDLEEGIGEGSPSIVDRPSFQNQQQMNNFSVDIEKTAKVTVVVALLVLVVGAIATTSFLYVGITGARHDQENFFVTDSADMVKEVADALSDYELAGMSIHESCRQWRSDNFTRTNFRKLYNYMSDASGLDFYAMEWVPNVTAGERPVLEQQFYQEFGTHNNATSAEEEEQGVEEGQVIYKGFVGVEDGSMDLIPRTPQPFYFPIQFFEPMEKVGELMHYDIWSAPWEAPAIASALETWSPVVTSGFKIVGSGEQDTFTVVLYHPGLPLPDRQPRDVSNILIQMKALLERAVRKEKISHGVYLFDSTDANQRMFLGGMDVKVSGSGSGGSGSRNEEEEEDDTEPNTKNKDLTFYPDYIEYQDLKDRSYLFYEEVIPFAARTWTIVVVPVDDFYKPAILGIVLSGALILVASLLLTSWMINNMRRSVQMHRVVTKAAAEASIVANLFPAKVRERMIKEAAAKEAANKNKKNNNNEASTSRQDVFLNEGNSTLCAEKLNKFMTSEGIFGSKPIADLHQNTTIMFADLAGFTSWSASREPTQVFMLLEVLYHSFDTIARRKGVFKVETIGDCYVAVAGLPEPRDDHAAVMCHFASACLDRMHKLCRALSRTLGPETEGLAFRVGLHSGSVTAGVLRGEKGRFQLFGDTMNMASRMESTGVRNKIQVSEATAQVLRDTGHQKWLTPREDPVEAKGKGTVQTYFVQISQESRASTVNSADVYQEEEELEYESARDAF